MNTNLLTAYMAHRNEQTGGEYTMPICQGRHPRTYGWLYFLPRCVRRLIGVK